MTQKSNHTRVALNGRWTDEITIPSGPKGSGGMSWSFGPLALKMDGDLTTLELPATTVALLFFDGTLPTNRAVSFSVRQGYRVLGSYVLERLENTSRTETLRLVMRCVQVATEEEQPPGPHDLAVISARSWGALCIQRSSGEIMRISCSGAKDLVPGECVRFHVRNSWTKGKTTFVSGEMEEPFIDLTAFRVPPLRLTQLGPWNPREAGWEDDEPVPAWLAAIQRRGPRPAFEMECVLPGEAPEDSLEDPIVEASEYRAMGDEKRARAILLKLLEQDIRCIDAHAHLGNFAFDRHLKRAIRHYRVGVELGLQALGDGFDGVLPWGLTENRPFLRAMHGYGLCLWRLGLFREAAAHFERMLWLNPADNQGVRMLLDEVKHQRAWTPDLA